MVSSNIVWDKIVVRKLRDTDDLSSFSCTDGDDLGCDDFIHKDDEAKLFQKERQGITYLFSHGDEIIGYVTVAMANIPARTIKGRYKRRVSLKYYPSMLIGRLGVSNSRRRQGVGAYLCSWGLGLAATFSEDIGCRYVILETSKGEREEFYLKCQFEKAKEMIEDNQERVWMYQRIAID